MNTDNMAISGETIDYGPCAFMDTYDPNTVFSSIDKHGRYAYKNQPDIGAWNLSRFAESLLPLIDSDEKRAVELAQAEIANYRKMFDKYWLNGMRIKMGIIEPKPEDAEFIADFLGSMIDNKLDYTNTFRALSKNNLAVIPRNHKVEEALAAAENGDLSFTHNLLAALRNPFEDSEEYSQSPGPNSCKYQTFCGT